jgi:hypothetical protein
MLASFLCDFRPKHRQSYVAWPCASRSGSFLCRGETKAPVWQDERVKLHIVFADLASASSCDPLDFAAIDAKVME